MVRLFRNMIETDMPKIERGKRERDRDTKREGFHCCLNQFTIGGHVL